MALTCDQLQEAFEHDGAIVRQHMINHILKRGTDGIIKDGGIHLDLDGNSLKKETS